jgi:predicted amidohydrolase
MGGANLSHFPENVRVASVQYRQQPLSTFEDFSNQLGHWVVTAAEQQADFIVLPELFTLQLLTLQHRKLTVGEALAILHHYTFKIEKSLRRLATQHRINIIGGTHLISRPNGQVENVCLVALRDGSLHRQSKIQIPQHESQTWSTCSGNFAHAIETDCGTVGILIGQDVESPELARRLANQGARVFFTPYSTALRTQYLRIRQAAQARAMENEVYVALCGNVGHLQGVAGMGSQYAQNAILSACDFTYSHEGILSEGTANSEMLVVADLQPGKLRERQTPDVRPAWSLDFATSAPASIFTARSQHRRTNSSHPHVPPAPAPAAPAYIAPMSASGRSC